MAEHNSSIPRMDYCIDSLGDRLVFSTLGAICNKRQVEIEDFDGDKMAFTSYYKLYQTSHMHFGLRNSPITFQRTIDMILSPVKWQFALVYLNDMFNFLGTADEHIEHVRTVSILLYRAGLTLNLKSCKFFKEKIYLGYMIHPSRLELPAHTTDAGKTLHHLEQYCI